METQTPEEKVTASVEAMMMSLERLDTSLGGHIASIQELLKDYKDAVQVGTMAELQVFRILEQHMLAGSCTAEVATSLMQQLQNVRKMAAANMQPILERLKARYPSVKPEPTETQPNKE